MRRLTFKLSPGGRCVVWWNRPYANQQFSFLGSPALAALCMRLSETLFYGPIKRFGIGAITEGVLGRGSEIDLNAYRYKIIIIDHNKLVKYGAINFHFTNIFRWPQLCALNERDGDGSMATPRRSGFGGHSRSHV